MRPEIIVLEGDTEEVWEWAWIRWRQEEQEKHCVDPYAEANKLRSEENAKKYLELSRERLGMAEIAKQMNVDVNLLRQWVKIDREYISNVNKYGSGEGSGIEILG